MKLLTKYDARSTSELYDKCTYNDWKELCEYLNYHELVKTGIELYVKYKLNKQRENMFSYACKQALEEKPIEEIQLEFKRLFKTNKICPREFSKNLLTILNKKENKLNTLRLWGVPNSGKTLIANCIAKPFITCYNNNHGSENEFYMSNFLNKSLLLCEELYITVSTAEDMKSVLGGQPIDIAKKFNEKQLLCRTPVIITSNHAKFGRGHLSPTDENALCLRCISYQFTHEFKPRAQLSSNQFYLFVISNLY